MREIEYYELGATLYIPILHKNLEDILSRRKYLYIKSVVICLEDSTSLCDIPEGMSRLKEILEDFSINSLKVFIRPRDIDNLKDILEFKNIEMVDGFALAKFGTANIG
jgi:citrate lyase beta subunit